MRNCIKKFIFCAFFLGGFLTGQNVWAVCHGITPNLIADSASMSDISDCVTAATYGDTINIPACADGDCVWDDSLTITKDVKIVGAGRDATYLVSNFGNNAKSFVVFQLDTTAYGRVNQLTDSGIIEIQGITFKGGASYGGQHHAIAFGSNANSNKVVRRFWAHHNRFDGIARIFTHSQTGEYLGNLMGVIDNNILANGTRYAYYTGADANTWNYFAPTFGSADNLYFEDNTCSSTEYGCGLATDHGGHYVYRYNTHTGTILSSNNYFESHGDQPTGIYSGLVNEVYGNNISATGTAAAFKLRGSRNIVFHNVLGQGLQGAYEEFSETNAGTTSYPNNCAEDGPQLCGIMSASGCVCQKIFDTYYLNNRVSVSGSFNAGKITGDSYDNNHTNSPRELTINRELWFDSRISVTDLDASTIQSAGTFNGTSGVGCGLLANRPETCTRGVGYWAADNDEICTDLTGYVGAAHTKNITGTFYQCGATGWSDGTTYTPYTYPHPLRNESAADTTAPAAPTNFIVN